MLINDEILTAYIDGELNDDQMRDVKAQLDNSPQLSTRVEEMRLMDDMVTKTYHAIDDRPMPESVLSLLQDTPDGQADHEHAHNEHAKGKETNILSFKKRQKFVSNAPVWQMGLAASIALFVGLGVGRGLPGPESSQPSGPILAQQTAGVITPQNALFAMLENQPSATPVVIDDDLNINAKPIMSFQNVDHEYCREFEISTAQASTRNIACRTDNVWTVKVAVATTKDLSIAGGQYQTASQAPEPIIDNMIMGLIKGDALSIDKEAELIKKNWQPQKNSDKLP